jgi:hypothetical protein
MGASPDDKFPPSEPSRAAAVARRTGQFIGDGAMAGIVVLLASAIAARAVASLQLLPGIGPVVSALSSEIVGGLLGAVVLVTFPRTRGARSGGLLGYAGYWIFVIS